MKLVIGLLAMNISSIYPFKFSRRLSTLPYRPTSLLRNTITSDSNLKIKLLQSLKFKKRRDESQLVLLEGHRMIIDTIKMGSKPKYIMYSEQALNSPYGLELQNILLGCEENVVHIVSDAVLKSIGDTVCGQGVVAAFRKPISLCSPINNTQFNLQRRPLLVLLDNFSDPGNMGTLIRSSYGLGADAVIIVGGCDVWAPKVIRSAMGLQLQLPIFEWDWEQVGNYTLGWNKKLVQKYVDNVNTDDRIMQVVIAEAGKDNVVFNKVDFKHPTILVIGSEAFGVSLQAFTLPNSKIVKSSIPMLRSLESFNAAVAGSIILAEASQQRFKYNL